jgi:hypothetical protein
MSTFFLTIIIAVCIIIIIKLLLENNKLKSSLLKNDNQQVDENKTHTKSINQFNSFQNNSSDKINSIPEAPSKNAFLHGADNFGEMIKGVVLDGKTYSHDNYKDASFKIQPAPKIFTI